MKRLSGPGYGRVSGRTINSQLCCTIAVTVECVLVNHGVYNTEQPNEQYLGLLHSAENTK